MRILILLLFSLSVGVLAGADISMGIHSKMYEALRTTSGIIFGVTGAWAAIVFPDTLTKIYNNESILNDKNHEIFSLLRKTMIIAVLIVSITLIFNILVPILKQFQFFIDCKVLLKMLSFATLVALTLVQIWSLLATLAPGEIIFFSLSSEQQKKTTHEDRNSITQDDDGDGDGDVPWD